MKNKILLTVVMAFIGLLSVGTSAEATPGHGNRHSHVFFERGNRVVVWHNNNRQCRGGFGYGNFNGVRTRMCMHMNNIWNGGRFGRAAIRCNHRGCNMFGMSFRNGRFFNGPRGNGFYRGNGNGRFNQGGGRGNGRFNRGGGGGNGRYNQGGGRGNGRYNQGGGRGNGRINQGGGRGNNGRINQGGGRGNGNGKGNGRGNGRGNSGR